MALAEAAVSTKQNVPPMRPIAKNLTQLPVAIEGGGGYDIYSWSPGTAEERVPSTEVHLSLPFKIDGIEARTVLRLKSSRALDELIGALLQHRRDVWGNR
jgi:hypothetical protein